MERLRLIAPFTSTQRSHDHGLFAECMTMCCSESMAVQDRAVGREPLVVIYYSLFYLDLRIFSLKETCKQQTPATVHSSGTVQR